MTPEELKAKEFIEKFRPFAHKNFTMANDGEIEKAKQCAIICVEMLINQFVALFNDFRENNIITTSVEDSENYKYWQRVLTEIEKY
jgi:hypothetical protein